MNKLRCLPLAFTLSSFLLAGGVNAQEGTNEPCYPAELIDFSQGIKTNNQPIGADRSDPGKALGEPDASNAAGGFVSLGVGGSITLSFDGVVLDQPGIDLIVYETSFSGNNCGANDDEFADIELSADGITFVFAETICRDGQLDIASYGLASVSQIRITNAAQTATSDGYDVDGVVAVNGCSPELVDEDPCYSSFVLDYIPGLNNQGQAIADPLRIDPSKALGAPQLNDTYNFVSLGYGGQLIVSFSGAGAINGPGDDIFIAETTFGNNTFASYPERADIFVSQNDVDYYLVGESFTSSASSFDIDAAGQGFEYITSVKIFDTTPISSVSVDAYDVDGVVALHGCTEPDPEIIVCEGVFRTQTQGGWGQPANGNNNGAYRNANFAAAFPEGLTIGCAEGFTLSLSSASAVQNFLPSGGQSNVFSENLIDPTGNEGAFTGNLTALTISVVFDNYDANFAPNSDYALEDLIVQSGIFTGFTVGEILAIANDVIGGCSNAYATNQLNTVVDGINNAYVDGNDSNGGLLGCEAPAGQSALITNSVNVRIAPNPSAGNVVISFDAVADERATLEVIDISGRIVATLYNRDVHAGLLYRFDFNGQHLPNGIYIAKLTGANYVATEKIMIAK